MIGIDEAGYGPNLGQLVVAASGWWVEEETAEGGGGKAEKSDSSVAVLAAAGRQRSTTTCLYRRLAKIVSRTASDRKLAIADSKQLYKPGHGLRQLERGVLVAFGACSALHGSGTLPAKWKTLLARHAPPLACYADYDCDLPIDATSFEIESLSNQFDAACALAGVQLADLRVRLVYPQEFNELTTRYGNKASALSHVSIGLLREVVAVLSRRAPSVSDGSAKTMITCDRHGGQNRYDENLQQAFPEEAIRTLV